MQECEPSLIRKADSLGSLNLISTIQKLAYCYDWLARHRPNLVLFGESLAEPAWSQA